MYEWQDSAWRIHYCFNKSEIVVCLRWIHDIQGGFFCVRIVLGVAHTHAKIGSQDLPEH